MAVDTENENGVEVNADDINTVDAEKQLNELQEKLERQTKLVEKLRDQEKHNQRLAREVGAKNLEEALKALQTGISKEAEKYKSDYENLLQEHTTLKDNIRNQTLDKTLREVLNQANVKDINTTLKVIDKSKIQWNNDEVDADNIKTIVEELKKSDPILFNETELPDVRRSNESVPMSGFEKEIKAATTQKEIEAVLKKYGKY